MTKKKVEHNRACIQMLPGGGPCPACELYYEKLARRIERAKGPADALMIAFGVRKKRKKKVEQC